MIPDGAADEHHEPERGRSWWRRWLGAVRDPDGSWEIGPVRKTADGTLRQPVDLTSYGTTMRAELLRPAGEDVRPAVVVPFYEVATLVGEPCARTAGHSAARRRSQAYARHLVARGFAVLAVPWWFEYVLGPVRAAASLGERYKPSVASHVDSLTTTGLGRSLADLFLAVDALAGVPWVDPRRIGAFGHSLGGKLALHLTALDTRIAAGVAHEPGLGLAYSNWADPWYLDGAVPPDRDHDDLLALVAPRPFLLAGGGASDGWHNHHLVERAARRWTEPSGLETLYHNSGHAHPDHVLDACYAWLHGRLAAADTPEETSPP
ncbi:MULTISPECIES: acetylxylan esterase [unclassified Micromonospora]|uniref:dienelactone hydrolase family protein n=1 Tax=unclassified Micromonospora TaxID=2617518 RepID=UPI00331CCEAB